MIRQRGKSSADSSEEEEEEADEVDMGDVRQGEDRMMAILALLTPLPRHHTGAYMPGRYIYVRDADYCHNAIQGPMFHCIHCAGSFDVCIKVRTDP